MAPEIRIDDFPLQDETDFIIGKAYEIHRQLGFGFAEIVYKRMRLKLNLLTTALYTTGKRNTRYSIKAEY